MTAIIDYGVGNLFSLVSSFEKIGEETTVTSDAGVLAAAKRLILPGVGAFGDAADKLAETGLVPVLLEQAKRGKPILGICLGMQLLFERSYEYGVRAGLGLIPGEVRPIAESVTGLKIPHMGWNALNFPAGGKHPLFRDIREGDHVYFVHSYHGVNAGDAVIATAAYGAPLTAAVAKGNVMGCQFHPEKSGDVGLAILKAFCRMKEGQIC